MTEPEPFVPLRGGPDGLLVLTPALEVLAARGPLPVRDGCTVQTAVGQQLAAVLATAATEAVHRAVATALTTTDGHARAVVAGSSAVARARVLPGGPRERVEVRLRAASGVAPVRTPSDALLLAWEHAPIGLALVDLDGRFLAVNPALADMLGYSAAKLTSLAFQDVTHGDDLEADLDKVDQLLRGATQHYDLEKRYIRKDGAVVWALLAVALVRSPDGAPVHFISQVLDTTERKAQELALAEERRRLDEAQHLSRVGSWEVDLVTGRVDRSDALYALYGLDRAGTADPVRAFAQCLGQEDAERLDAAQGRCLATGQDQRLLHRVQRSGDGSVRWVECTLRAVPGPAGEPLRLLGTAADVTQRLAVEHELRLQRIAAVDAHERSRLASDAHDDLLQILVAASMRTELLRIGSLPADASALGALADLLGTSIARLRRLVGDVSEGPVEPHLAVALRRAADELFGGTPTAVAVEAPDWVDLSPSAVRTLHKVVGEALTNVRKHAQASSVLVRVVVEREHVVALVRDDGVGAPTLVGAPGHVGLAAMRSRTLASGGELEVTSTPGSGTSVRLVLPRVAVPA